MPDSSIHNEIEILLRQLESVSNLLSKQTRELGGFDSDIRTFDDRIKEIKRDVSRLFENRNEIRQNCLKNCSEINRKNEMNLSAIETNSKHISQLSDKCESLDTSVNAYEDRIQSIEGFVANVHEQERERAIREDRERNDIKAKIFTISWDIAKLFAEVLIAIGAAYLTEKWAG